MLVQQMHIEVNQRLQEVASYKRDKLFPEEIDLALNKAMFRLLEKGVNERFQETELNLSHVSALIKKNKVSEVIIPSQTDPLYEDPLKSVYSTVAPDLFWIINGRAEVVKNPLVCDTEPTLSTTNYSEWTAVVPFPDANVSAPYYVNVAITSSVLGTLYTAPSPFSAGFNSTTSKYRLIDNILEYFYRHSTLKVYWERYRDVYYKNSFIFVNPTNQGTVTISGTGLTSSVVTASQTVYTIYNRSAILSPLTRTLAPVKIHEQDLLYSSLKENKFYRSLSIEVSMDQTYDYFILYREESFLVTRFYYDYIRKPRTISLALNQSCELADVTHPKIIDLAVEILRLDTKDQAYPQTVQDIELRTK